MTVVDLDLYRKLRGSLQLPRPYRKPVKRKRKVVPILVRVK